MQQKSSSKTGKHLRHHVGGVAQLITHFGNEVVDVVQDVHGAVANPFSIRGKDYVPAPMVYQLVRYGFRQLGNVVGLTNILRDPSKERKEFLDLQSILNGIFGQLYEEQNSNYAITMQLTPNDFRPETKTLVVFAHGLCMNDACWYSPAAQSFARWVEEQFDAEVAYLRYNTGLHISDNGRKLAGLLDHTPLPQRVILIGHSMGGLVARSALHQARLQERPWAEKVTHLITLASPHEGAVLERLGNYVNRMLALTRYTKPLMRLGNLRSNGIRDLRFGYLVEEQWQAKSVNSLNPSPSVPLDDKAEQLFVAASTSASTEGNPSGDWLVDVPSGLGLRYYPVHPKLQRKVFYRMAHMTIIEEPRLYEYVQQWLHKTTPADARK